MPSPAPDDAEAGDGSAPLLSPAEGGGAHPAMPRWYTPKRLLALICFMQYMVYMDRGVRAARSCRGVLSHAPTPLGAKTS